MGGTIPALEGPDSVLEVIIVQKLLTRSVESWEFEHHHFGFSLISQPSLHW